jgi:hypothetical protein
MKRKGAFRLTQIADPLPGLVATTDPRILGLWARDCALRVLPWFEAAFPNDPRPRQALETLQAWIDTGEFHMAVIRKASLDAHAAARDVGSDTPARSAARAAGQAVATAHVSTHAPGAAQYALQAIDRASADPEAVLLEQAWQVEHLAQLRGSGQNP